MLKVAKRVACVGLDVLEWGRLCRWISSLFPWDFYVGNMRFHWSILRKERARGSQKIAFFNSFFGGVYQLSLLYSVWFVKMQKRGWEERERIREAREGKEWVCILLPKFHFNGRVWYNKSWRKMDHTNSFPFSLPISCPHVGNKYLTLSPFLFPPYPLMWTQ